MNIVWAYRDTDDVPNDGMFAQHSMQGGMEYTFIEDTNGGGDGGDGGDGGGNGSSSMATPSVLGIIALFLFQRVIGP